MGGEGALYPDLKRPVQEVASGIDAGHRIHPGWRSVSGCGSVGFLWAFQQRADCFFSSCSLFFPGFSLFQSPALENLEADAPGGSNQGLWVIVVGVQLGNMEAVPSAGPSCSLVYPGELELHNESGVCIPLTLNELDDHLRSHIYGV